MCKLTWAGALAALAAVGCGNGETPAAASGSGGSGSACPKPGISKRPWTLGIDETSARLRWEACADTASRDVELTPEGGGAAQTFTATSTAFTIDNTYYAPFNADAPADEAGTYFNRQALLTGLTAGTCYRYRVGGSDAHAGRFCTARAPGSSFRVLAMADTNPGLGDATKRLLAVADELDYDFSIHAGDVQYYASGFDTWVYWFSALAPMLRQGAFYPSIGNHELENDDEYDQYYLRFFDKAGFGGTDAYYRVDSGGVSFFTLNTEATLDAASEQLGWFKGEIAAAKARPGYRFSVVYFHKPFITCGDKSQNGSARQLFEPLFEEHGVALVVQGHMHGYERFEVPLSDPTKTITYLTVGGGGGLLGDIDANADRPVCAQRKSHGKFHHMALLEITASGLAGRVFDPDGVTRDEFDIASP